MKHLTKRLVGRRVIGEPITGSETTAELFEKAFGAFVGREVKNAYEIIKRMIEKDHTVVLAFPGAMTPVDSIYGKKFQKKIFKRGKNTVSEVEKEP